MSKVVPWDEIYYWWRCCEDCWNDNKDLEYYINLVDVALSSDKNKEDFWKILDERLELCHRALQIRHKRLSKATSDVAPILWQNGALARLEKGESIHELLHHGYSTISLGYAGLYECVKFMTGHSHTDGGCGKEFGIAVMERLNEKCKEWKLAEDIDYSVYNRALLKAATIADLDYRPTKAKYYRYKIHSIDLFVNRKVVYPNDVQIDINSLKIDLIFFIFNYKFLKQSITQCFFII